MNKIDQNRNENNELKTISREFRYPRKKQKLKAYHVLTRKKSGKNNYKNKNNIDLIIKRIDYISVNTDADLWIKSHHIKSHPIEMRSNERVMKASNQLVCLSNCHQYQSSSSM